MTRIRETKEIAVYGAYKREIPPHRESHWKTIHEYKRGKIQVKEHKRRVWYGSKKPRLSATPEKGRYEFHSNNNRALYRAMVNAHAYMPKGYVRVDAEDFNEHPENYGVKGEWINRKVSYRGGTFT
jgi:hypothetical protein